MMFLAENRGPYTRTLGINLVLFKDKRPVRGIKEDINVPVIVAEGGEIRKGQEGAASRLQWRMEMTRAVLYDKMEPGVYSSHPGTVLKIYGGNHQ